MQQARTGPVRVVAAVAWRDDRVLMTQRPPGGPLGLSWEFPGGKIENGETPQHALVREIREELGVGATAGAIVATTRHAYDHGLDVEIIFVACTLDSFAFRSAPEIHDVRWVRPQDVDPGEVLEADRAFLKTLRRR